MMGKDDGGPAFPALEPAWTDMNGHNLTDGMSLRDYFAAQALNGLVANPGTHASGQPDYDDTISAAAITSYHMADAMLEARKK